MNQIINENEYLPNFTRDQVAYTLLFRARKFKLVGYLKKSLKLTPLILERFSDEDIFSVICEVMAKTMNAYDVFLINEHNDPQAKARIEALKEKGKEFNPKLQYRFDNISILYGYLAKASRNELLKVVQKECTNKRRRVEFSIYSSTYKDVQGKEETDRHILANTLHKPATRDIEEIEEELYQLIKSKNKEFINSVNLRLHKVEDLKTHEVFRRVFVERELRDDVRKDLGLTDFFWKRVLDFIDKCFVIYRQEFQSAEELYQAG